MGGYAAKELNLVYGKLMLAPFDVELCKMAGASRLHKDTLAAGVKGRCSHKG